MPHEGHVAAAGNLKQNTYLKRFYNINKNFNYLRVFRVMCSLNASNYSLILIKRNSGRAANA